MHNEYGWICGIRLRGTDGGKWAVRGSRAGLFLPQGWHGGEHAVLVEGPTDAAACLDLGLAAIGRPSCLGCEETVIRLAQRWGVTRMTVVADNDGPGIQGARRLADALGAARMRWRLVTAGGLKDMREWLRNGATRQTVELTWSQALWR
jgi:DNA primase